jgi:hypothetical protein
MSVHRLDLLQSSCPLPGSPFSTDPYAPHVNHLLASMIPVHLHIHIRTLPELPRYNLADCSNNCRSAAGTHLPCNLFCGTTNTTIWPALLLHQLLCCKLWEGVCYLLIRGAVLALSTVVTVLLNRKDSPACGNVILVVQSIVYRACWVTNRESCRTRQCTYSVSMSYVCATTTGVEKQ